MGEKKIGGAAEGREPWSQRNVREREREREREKAAHRGPHKKNTSPKPLTGKIRRDDFRGFLQ